MATSSLDRLASWFKTAPGRRLLAEQTPLISECARRFHGDTLLWAGCQMDLTETVRGCMIRSHIVLMPGSAGEGDVESQEGALFRADPHDLPLPNNSLDAVVLHHVLETAGDPRAALREVSRVLAPGGRLLIVSINPWSLWGLRGVYGRFCDDSFSGLRLVSTRRLLDWLTVLGFELQQDVKYLAYNMPFSSAESDRVRWPRARAWLAGSRLPVGGAYVVSTVKQVAAIRPDWSLPAVSGRKLAPSAYPNISARIARLPRRRGSPDSQEQRDLKGIEGIEDPG